MRFYTARPHGENGKVDLEAPFRIIKAPLGDAVHRHLNKKTWTVAASTTDELMASKGKFETVDVAAKDPKPAKPERKPREKKPFPPANVVAAVDGLNRMAASSDSAINPTGRATTRSAVSPTASPASTAQAGTESATPTRRSRTTRADTSSEESNTSIGEEPASPAATLPRRTRGATAASSEPSDAVATNETPAATTAATTGGLPRRPPRANRYRPPGESADNT